MDRVVRRDVLRIEQQAGLKRLPERLGNTGRDQPLDRRRFLPQRPDQPARVHMPEWGLDRRDMHLAKPVDRPGCRHPIPRLLPAVPGFAQPMHPARLEPVPEPQDEIMLPLLAGSLRPLALVGPRPHSQQERAIGFRQAARRNPLAIAGSLPGEMLIGKILTLNLAAFV